MNYTNEIQTWSKKGVQKIRKIIEHIAWSPEIYTQIIRREILHNRSEVLTYFKWSHNNTIILLSFLESPNHTFCAINFFPFSLFSERISRSSTCVCFELWDLDSKTTTFDKSNHLKPKHNLRQLSSNSGWCAVHL